VTVAAVSTLVCCSYFGIVRRGYAWMVDPKVELVETLLDAFAARDVGAAQALVADDAEFLAVGTAGQTGRDEPYRGHAGVREYFKDIARVWRELRVVPSRMEPVERGVLVMGRLVARDGKGFLIDVPAGWLIEIAAGKVTRIEIYQNDREAVRAAGLES
jgi:ketosteroid isomerase-like protein